MGIPLSERERMECRAKKKRRNGYIALAAGILTAGLSIYYGLTKPQEPPKPPEKPMTSYYAGDGGASGDYKLLSLSPLEHGSQPSKTVKVAKDHPELQKLGTSGTYVAVFEDEPSIMADGVVDSTEKMKILQLFRRQ